MLSDRLSAPPARPEPGEAYKEKRAGGSCEATRSPLGGKPTWLETRQAVAMGGVPCRLFPIGRRRLVTATSTHWDWRKAKRVPDRPDGDFPAASRRQPGVGAARYCKWVKGLG